MPKKSKLLTKTAISMFDTRSNLAKALKIKKSAISQWGEFVPQLREYQIRELKPESKNN